MQSMGLLRATAGPVSGKLTWRFPTGFWEEDEGGKAVQQCPVLLGTQAEQIGMAGDRVQSFLLIGKSPHRHQAMRRAQLVMTRPTDRAADCFSTAASSTNMGLTGPSLWQRWRESGIREFPWGDFCRVVQGDENGIPPGKGLRELQTGVLAAQPTLRGADR